MSQKTEGKKPPNQNLFSKMLEETVDLFMCLRKQLRRTSQHWVPSITFIPGIFPDMSKFHLKQKSSIKQSFEIIYSFMVVKYGNIILLMETIINGTCYKVSTDGLYRLGSCVPRTL